MMHSALGETYALASGSNVAIGALAGGMGEALSGLASSSSSAHAFSGTGASGTGLSNWIDTGVAVASLLAGGSAKDISLATTVSSSVVEYNQRVHPDQLKALQELQQGTDEKTKQRFEDATMSLIHGEEGVDPIKDPDYKQIRQSVIRGQSYTAEREELMLSGAFERGFIDRIEEVASRNDDIITKSLGKVKFVSGVSGMFASAAITSTGFGAIPGMACGTMSGMYALEGYKQVYDEYNYNEGAKVLQSLRVNTPTYFEEKTPEIVRSILYTGAAQGLARHGGPVLGKTIDYTLNPQIIVQDFKVLSNEASAIGSLVKNSTGNGTKYVGDSIKKIWNKVVNPTSAAKNRIQNIEKTNIARAEKLNAGYTKAIDELTNIQKSLVIEINKNSSKTVARVTKKTANDNTRLRLVETPKNTVVEGGKFNKAPYDPRKMERLIKKNYAGEKVTSSTLPEINAQNVKLAGKRHPVSGVVYDQKGFPIFDDFAVYTTKLPIDISKIKDSKTHMRAVTRELREQIHTGKIDKNIFNQEQLNAIMKGKEKIPGYTLHHHQDIGRMQIIPEELHDLTKHIGGMSLWLKE